MTTSDEQFLRVARSIRTLFHQLRALADKATPAIDGFTASHRAVLESLSAHGPETVPALARARPVARQHIQVLVNDLLAMGLVEALPNPAHKRSPLIGLTATGRRRFEEIRRAERALLRATRLPLSVAELRRVAEQLEVLSEGLRAVLSQPER